MGTNGDESNNENGTLAAAVGGVIGLAILFFVIGILCYCLIYLICRDQVKESTRPEGEGWEAKHYYDPPPSLLTPDVVFQPPSQYSFKIHNNGTTSTPQPRAVINPAVLQYPPGHIFEEQNFMQPGIKPTAQSKRSPRRGSRIFFTEETPFVVPSSEMKKSMSNGFYSRESKMKY